jgi:predicted DNA binding protein
MYRVTLSIRPPSSWALDVASKHDVPILILDCIPHGEDGVEGLIEIDGDPEVQKRVIQTVQDHPDIIGLHLANHCGGKIMASVMASNWIACRTILKSDCYLRGARTISEGTIEWELLTKDERSLSRLLEDLAMAECQVEIRSKIAVKEPYALTTRQENIVRLALERGYYDFPRRTTARDLARCLGISQSTLSETLQRSERKLVEFYLKNRA